MAKKSSEERIDELIEWLMEVDQRLEHVEELVREGQRWT